jgi:hypothetical protein
MEDEMHEKNKNTGNNIALAVILLFLAFLALLAGAAGSQAQIVLLGVL